MLGRWLGMLVVVGCVAVLAAPGAVALDAASKEACKLAQGAGASSSDGAAGGPDACRTVGEVCDDGGNTEDGIAIDEPGVHRACTLAADLDGDGMLDVVVARAAEDCASAADGQHDIPGLDMPEACSGVSAGADMLRKGHEMSKSIIQNIRA